MCQQLFSPWKSRPKEDKKRETGSSTLHPTIPPLSDLRKKNSWRNGKEMVGTVNVTFERRRQKSVSPLDESKTADPTIKKGASTHYSERDQRLQSTSGRHSVRRKKGTKEKKRKKKISSPLVPFINHFHRFCDLDDKSLASDVRSCNRCRLHV